MEILISWVLLGLALFYTGMTFALLEKWRER